MKTYFSCTLKINPRKRSDGSYSIDCDGNLSSICLLEQPRKKQKKKKNKVVEEISLLPLTYQNLDFHWENELISSRNNVNIFCSPSIPSELISSLMEEDSRGSKSRKYWKLDFSMAGNIVQQTLKGNKEFEHFFQGSPFSCFDIAIISSPKEIDLVIRPKEGIESSLLRPRGAILCYSQFNISQNSLTTESNIDTLMKSITQRNISIYSSRCGSFQNALTLLEKNPIIGKNLEEALITQVYPLNQIEKAFQIAKDSKNSIKVIIQTSETV